MRIFWGRVMTGGLVGEVLVFALVFPVRAAFGQQAFLASIVIGSAATPLPDPGGHDDTHA